MKGGYIMPILRLLETTTVKAATSVTSGDNPFTTMTTPIIGLLNSALSPLIALVVAVGAIYCVLLGVKLAKAEEPQEREKAKQHLKNAIIGFLLIFILVVALRLGMDPMIEWMNQYN